MPDFKLFLVDYDDCFHHTNVHYRLAWTQVFADHGAELTDAALYELNRVNQLPGAYLQQLIGPCSESQLAAIENDVRSYIRSGVVNYGALEMIEQAKSHGLTVVLWTQSPKQWVADTAPPGALDVFDGFVFEANKPHAFSVFQAAQRAGCELREVVGVDNASPGIRALRSSGAFPVHYEVEGEPPLGMDGIVSVKCLSEIDLATLPSRATSRLSFEVSR